MNPDIRNMKLTPLKVKGKGPRPKPWVRPDPNSRKRKQEDIDEARKKRRRLKSQSGAPIERLPTEILERIFHFSENMNFPRSSLRIGWLLSNKSFLTELIVSAFGPTWDCVFGLKANEIPAREWKKIKGNPKYQNAVLACNWFTLELLFDAEKIWFRKARGHEPPPDSLLGHWIPDKMESYYKMRFGRLLEMANRPDEDRQKAIRGAGRSDAIEFTWQKNQVMLSRVAVDMHPGVHIPDRLLVAPFTWDKAGLLMWMNEQRFAGNMTPDQTWELTLPAFKQGIRLLENRELAYVMALLYLQAGVYNSWPISVISDHDVHMLSDPPGIEDDPITEWTNSLIDKMWDCRERDGER